MRKIVVAFEVPEDIADDYVDMCAALVFESLFPSEISYRIISDTNPPENTKEQPCEKSVTVS